MASYNTSSLRTEGQEHHFPTQAIQADFRIYPKTLKFRRTLISWNAPPIERNTPRCEKELLGPGTPHLDGSAGQLILDCHLGTILEGACLETGKLGKDHVLLNCDDHNHFLRKHNRDPTEARPDILHQVARSEPKL